MHTFHHKDEGHQTRLSLSYPLYSIISTNLLRLEISNLIVGILLQSDIGPFH